MERNDDGSFQYQQQYEISVFINNLNGITIKQNDYFNGEDVVMLNLDAATQLIKALKILVKELRG